MINISNIIYSFILSLVEVTTEFVPVSSTAHLLFATKLLKINSIPVFQIAIITMQLGAILGLCVVFKKTLFPSNLTRNELKKFLLIYLKLLIAFTPTAVSGVLFYDTIKDIFFKSSIPSSILLVIGGLFLIKKYDSPHRKSFTLQNIPLKIIIIIGFFQALSVFPGVSRAGATVIGALFLGLTIKTALEISFFLALPTISAASLYEIIFGKIDIQGQSTSVLNLISENFNGYLPVLVSSFVFSFILSVFIVPNILKFTQKHGLRVFGFYRIILGLTILILCYI